MSGPEAPFDLCGHPTIIANSVGIGIGTIDGSDCLYVRGYNRAHDLQMVLPLTKEQAADFASKAAQISFLLKDKKEDRS